MNFFRKALLVLKAMITFVIAFVITFVTACIAAPPQTPTPTTGISGMIDPSVSTGADRCVEFGADLREVMHRSGVGRVDVTLLGVGDATSGDEPLVLIAVATYKPASGAFAKPGTMERSKTAFIERLVADCDRRLLKPHRSPVFVAIKRAVESLSAMCERLAHNNVACDRRLLFLHSDFRENREMAIRDALFGKRGKNTKLPRIDLEGVEVTACGMSDTYQDPDAPPIPLQRLQATWSEVFGKEVQIAAGCPTLERADLLEAAP